MKKDLNYLYKPLLKVIESLLDNDAKKSFFSVNKKFKQIENENYSELCRKAFNFTPQINCSKIIYTITNIIKSRHLGFNQSELEKISSHAQAFYYAGMKIQRNLPSRIMPYNANDEIIINDLKCKIFLMLNLIKESLKLRHLPAAIFLHNIYQNGFNVIFGKIIEINVADLNYAFNQYPFVMMAPHDISVTLIPQNKGLSLYYLKIKNDIDGELEEKIPPPSACAIL